jgi:hypothetical protein
MEQDGRAFGGGGLAKSGIRFDARVPINSDG